MPKTILFLASSPSDKARLRLDIEQREIQADLQRSKFRNEFDFKSQPALRFQDLIHTLRETKPWAVHFSGHGDGDLGLVLEDTNGKTLHLDNEILNQIFALLKNHTQCVLLNACYSEQQAKQIAQHIPYVVGMNKAIPDNIGIQFAQQFYAGLGAGETVENAFNWAKIAVMGMNKLDANIPVLYKHGQLITPATTIPSTELPQTPNTMTPIKAFVSYAHKDAEHLPHLTAALSPLVRTNKLVLWTDHNIEVGSDWEQTIMQQLNEADIVICLVSADFIASNFCYTQEFETALESHKQGTKIIIPIRLRTCAYEDLPLGKIQGTPAKWIASSTNKDESWTEAVNAIKKVINSKLADK